MVNPYEITHKRARRGVQGRGLVMALSRKQQREVHAALTAKGENAGWYDQLTEKDAKRAGLNFAPQDKAGMREQVKTVLAAMAKNQLTQEDLNLNLKVEGFTETLAEMLQEKARPQKVHILSDSEIYQLALKEMRQETIDAYKAKHRGEVGIPLVEAAEVKKVDEFEGLRHLQYLADQNK
jgi:hypothetical protein